MTDKPDLTGLSPLDCPYDCRADRCVISGINFCAHPFKGGLQGALQAQPDVVDRYQQARKLLHNQKVKVSGDGAEQALSPTVADPDKSPPRHSRANKRKRKKPAPKPKASPNASALPPTSDPG